MKGRREEQITRRCDEEVAERVGGQIEEYYILFK